MCSLIENSLLNLCASFKITRVNTPYPTAYMSIVMLEVLYVVLTPLMLCVVYMLLFTSMGNSTHTNVLLKIILGRTLEGIKYLFMDILLIIIHCMRREALCYCTHHTILIRSLSIYQQIYTGKTNHSPSSRFPGRFPAKKCLFMFCIKPTLTS